MKTPEKIKRDMIECMEEANWVVEVGDAHDLIDSVEKAHETMADARSFIRRLEQDNAQKDERIRQLEREREALIKVAHGQCRACKHKLSFSPFDEPCCKCRNIWPGHGFESRWEWRGVEEDFDA